MEQTRTTLLCSLQHFFIQMLLLGLSRMYVNIKIHLRSLLACKWLEHKSAYLAGQRKSNLLLQLKVFGRKKHILKRVNDGLPVGIKKKKENCPDM